MSRSLGILLILVSACILISANEYTGYKVYELTPNNADQLSMLHKLSSQWQLYDFITLSPIHGQLARVMVHPKAQTDFEKSLKKHSLKYKITTKNVGETLERDFRMNQMLRKLIPANSTRLTTERYNTLDEINAYIEELAVRYPTRAFIKTVGKSYEGRIMKTITITNGDRRTRKNVILMDGGFHAREWIAHATVAYAIEQLVENFEENAELLEDYDWVVLPVVNPDGYAYTHISSETRGWRKTRQPLEYQGKICVGTDPNRNFDFHWNEEGASDDPCSNTFAGPRPFSEPEAVVVRDLIHSMKGRGIAYWTVHTSGRLILYPWGWSSDLPDTWPDLHEVGMAGNDAIYLATGQNWTVGSSTNVLYVAAGASDDYAFNAGFPISYTLELPGGGDMGYNPPPSSIDGFVKESWTGIRAMAVKVLEKYPLKKMAFF